VNPETLSLYPRRIGTNRPNPYTFPGAFDRLANPGYLQVYENRQCGAGGLPVPLTALGVDPAIIPPALNDLIANAIFNANGNGQTPAPPCELQPDFPTSHTHYPHVTALPPAG
jgi:hypothetical protein